MDSKIKAMKLRKRVSLLIAAVLALGGMAAVAEEAISASIHVNATARPEVSEQNEEAAEESKEETAEEPAEETEARQEAAETEETAEETAEEASEETSEETAEETEETAEETAEEAEEAERVDIKELNITFDTELTVGQTAHATMTIKVGNAYGVVPRDFKMKPETTGAEISLGKKKISGLWANNDGLLSDGDKESNIFKLEFDVTPAQEDFELKFTFLDNDEEETKFGSETVSFHAEAAEEAIEETVESEATEAPTVEPVLSIQTNGDPASMVAGDTLEMTAGISGMDGVDYSIVWQCNYGGEWNDVPGTEGAMSYSVELTEDNLGCSWRFKLSTPDEEPEQEQDVE